MQELWSVYTMKIDLHVTVLYCVYVFCIHSSLCLQFTPSLTEEDVKEDTILPLKFVKFQTVHSITVSKCGWRYACICCSVVIYACLHTVPDLCEGQPRRRRHHSDKPHWIVRYSKRHHQGQPGECYIYVHTEHFRVHKPIYLSLWPYNLCCAFIYQRDTRSPESEEDLDLDLDLESILKHFLIGMTGNIVFGTYPNGELKEEN